MVGDDSCRIVRRRTRRRHLRAVGVAAVRALESANARHLLPNRAVAVHPVGIELHAHGLRVEVMDGQLNLERMVLPVGLDLHGAKPERGPLLLHRVPPGDHLPAQRAVGGRARTVGRGSREVVLLGVLAHRTVGGEAWCQPRHALPHPRDPGGRDARLVAGVELRHHLPFEPVVERLGFGRVPGGIVAMVLAVAQRPADVRSVGFRPPAVQFRQIETSIDEHLHAARPTGFPRPPGRVDPDINPLHQVLGQEHVVVAEEDDVGARLGPPDEADPLLNQGLPGLVRRMGLAGDDDLHRALGIVQEAKQAFRVVQQQVRSLVGREAARETQRQRVGIEQMLRLVHRLRRRAAGGELPGQSFAREFDEGRWWRRCAAATAWRRGRREWSAPGIPPSPASGPFRRPPSTDRRLPPSPSSACGRRS